MIGYLRYVVLGYSLFFLGSCSRNRSEVPKIQTTTPERVKPNFKTIESFQLYGPNCRTNPTQPFQWRDGTCHACPEGQDQDCEHKECNGKKFILSCRTSVIQYTTSLICWIGDMQTGLIEWIDEWVDDPDSGAYAPDLGAVKPDLEDKFNSCRDGDGGNL